LDCFAVDTNQKDSLKNNKAFVSTISNRTVDTKQHQAMTRRLTSSGLVASKQCHTKFDVSSSSNWKNPPSWLPCGQNQECYHVRTSPIHPDGLQVIDAWLPCGPDQEFVQVNEDEPQLTAVFTKNFIVLVALR